MQADVIGKVESFMTEKTGSNFVLLGSFRARIHVEVGKIRDKYEIEQRKEERFLKNNDKWLKVRYSCS